MIRNRAGVHTKIMHEQRTINNAPVRVDLRTPTFGPGGPHELGLQKVFGVLVGVEEDSTPHASEGGSQEPAQALEADVVVADIQLVAFALTLGRVEVLHQVLPHEGRDRREGWNLRGLKQVIPPLDVVLPALASHLITGKDHVGWWWNRHREKET